MTTPLDTSHDEGMHGSLRRGVDLLWLSLVVPNPSPFSLYCSVYGEATVASD
jgi:hypothetical protein